jgi:GAF domain-containing protein
VPGAEHVRTFLCAPVVAQGRMIGALMMDNARVNFYHETDARIALALAQHLAIAIENTRLFEAEQTRRTELAALYDLSRALVELNDMGVILNFVVQRSVEKIRVTFARIALIEGDECVLRAAYPVRGLERDLGIGQRETIQTLPLCFDASQQNAPMILRHDAPNLSEAERAALFLGFAQSLCLVPLRSGDRALGLLMLGETRRAEREPFTAEKINLARGIGDQAASALHRAELFAQLERSYLETVLALANAVDAKDTYTADHAKRLAVMALAVGRELGLGAHELVELRYGAILHDIGKIGVPDAILRKPGKLDDEEWKIMRHHPEIGSRILAPVPRLAGAARIVRHHHERYDGKGYPDRLVGEAIPLGARILTVVDSFSAIMDARVYKAARSQADAVAELKKHTGTQFDARVVETFLRLLERGLDITGGGGETLLEWNALFRIRK